MTERVGRGLEAAVERMRAAQAAVTPELLAAREGAAAAQRAAYEAEMEADWALNGSPMDQRRDEQWAEICPSLYLGARIDDIDGDSRALIEEWRTSPRGRNLLIAGSVGTGKTHAALATGREIHLAGRSVDFWPMVELWDALRPGGPEGLISEVCDVDLLVLDDLGAEKPSDWTAERLFLIVNRRALDEVPTIATTNLVGKDLRAAVGVRVYDRLVNERTVTVVFEGGSRRGRARRG